MEKGREDFIYTHHTLSGHWANVQKNSGETPEMIGLNDDGSLLKTPAVPLEVDFGRLLSEKRELEQKGSFSPEEWDNLRGFFKANPQILQSTYSRVIGRLLEETNYYHEGLEAANYAKAANIPEPQFVFTEGSQTHVVTWTGKIYVDGGLFGKNLPPDFVITSLASIGRLPFYTADMNWGTIHYLYGRSRGGKLSSKDAELQEIHAKRAGKYYEGIKDLDNPAKRLRLDSAVELFEQYQGHCLYGLKDEKYEKKTKLAFMRPILNRFIIGRYNEDRLIYAIAAIDRLDALGFRTGDIIHTVIRRGSWSQKRAVYPRIEKVIEDRLNELRLDESDLDTLVHAHKLELVIEGLRAKHIAIEELVKMAADNRLQISNPLTKQAVVYTLPVNPN